MNDDVLTLRRLFDRASELGPPERVAFLAEQCTDPQVRAQLERLLAVHDAPGSFLAEPAAMLTRLNDLTHTQADDPLIGFHLGSYRIVSLLGAGGMGLVYRAEQSLPRRTVALKVIRVPGAADELRRRFTLEAEALGRLQHSSIAQIFEAGVAPDPVGREIPYLAMELVVGTPLLEWSSAASPRQRLELFARVCDGVQHAHQKGVIHRDLKPANILVEQGVNVDPGAGDHAPLDPSGSLAPAPKILDFGVARLTATDRQDLTTLRTESGAVVGTLAYMSPEQVRGEVRSVDARSDIYSLGVILYELLTGDLPYPVRGKPIGEVARIISDEDATLPSIRTRELRGDLETILLKALEKDPLRRYQSAAEVAADIRRHLADLPIIARPATATYQIRKFARRHRAIVAGIAATILALAIGMVGTTLGMLRARDAQRAAQASELSARAEARKAGRSVEFLVAMLTGADPNQTAGRDVTVRELLDTASKGVGEELRDDPEVHLAARSAIARTYRAIGDPQKATEHYEVVMELVQSLGRQGGPAEADVLHQMAHVQEDTRDWRKVIELATRALAIREGGGDTGSPEVGRLCATLSGAYVAINDLKQGQALAQRAFDIATQQKQDEDLAAAAGMLSTILQRVGGPTASAQGEQLARLQVDVMVKLHGAMHTSTLSAREDLGWFLQSERRSAEALPLLRESLEGFQALYGTRHRRTLHCLTLVGAVQQSLGDLDSARSTMSQAVEALREVAPDSSELSSALWRSAIIKDRLKDLPAAESDAREALEIRRRTGDARVSVTISTLASILSHQGRYDDAIALEREAIELRRKSGNLLSDFGTMLNNLALDLSRSGKHEEAETTFSESVQYDRSVRPGNPLNAFNLLTFTDFLQSRGKSAQAEPLAREAVELLKKGTNPEKARAARSLAAVLDSLGKHQEAQSLRAVADELSPAPAPTK